MATGTIIPPGQLRTEEEVVESSLSAIEEADRSHQVATARRFPRSIAKFVQDLEDMTCLNQKTAEQSMYSIPRGGKQIIGPSVRFAEAAIIAWGNVRAGVEVVDIDKSGSGAVTAEGRFYDCEKNVGLAIRVRRRNVMTKKDDDSYQVTGQAASSIAFRSAALRGIPQALWGPIFEKAKDVAAGATSLDQARIDTLGLLNKMGVTSERVFKALGVAGLQDVGRDEFLVMHDFIKRLKAKEITIEELFGSPLLTEIEAYMDLLKYPHAKRQMSNTNYRDNPQAQLAHLKDEAKNAGLSLAPQGAPPSTSTSPQPTPAPQSESAAPQDSASSSTIGSQTEPITLKPAPEVAQPAQTVAQTAAPQQQNAARPARRAASSDW